MSTKTILFLACLILFSLLIRTFRITEPNQKYFDEVYHVVTAEGYAKNNPDAYNPWAPPPEPNTAFDWLHPPFAKLIQALSINTLGDSPFGWRIPSAIFGTGIVVATFVLAYFLFGIKVAIFSSIVIAFENLNLVMSRITMNDVFVTFFILSSFIFAHLYLSSNKIRFLLLTSLSLGLAISSKWTGMYAIAAILLYLLINRIKERRLKILDVLVLVLPPLIYLMSYGQYWLQGHSWEQFVELHKQIWAYQNRHDLEHPYGSTPIYCVPGGLNGPKTFCPWVLDIRPVYYSYQQYGSRAGYIYALGNPLIFWIGFVAVCYLTIYAIRKKSKNQLLILLGYFIFWVPWILTPRIMFLSHYLPSIPFLAISLGVVLNKLYSSGYKYVAYSIIVLFIFIFFYFYPITSGYPIKISSIEKFMWISSWR